MILSIIPTPKVIGTAGMTVVPLVVSFVKTIVIVIKTVIIIPIVENILVSVPTAIVPFIIKEAMQNSTYRRDNQDVILISTFYLHGIEQAFRVFHHHVVIVVHTLVGETLCGKTIQDPFGETAPARFPDRAQPLLLAVEQNHLLDTVVADFHLQQAVVCVSVQDTGTRITPFNERTHLVGIHLLRVKHRFRLTHILRSMGRRAKLYVAGEEHSNNSNKYQSFHIYQFIYDKTDCKGKRFFSKGILKSLFLAKKSEKALEVSE